jgi:hypothetical protein
VDGGGGESNGVSALFGPGDLHRNGGQRVSQVETWVNYRTQRVPDLERGALWE